MKKALAIVLTVAFLLFGATFGSVSAGNGDGLPEEVFPLSLIDQG